MNFKMIGEAIYNKGFGKKIKTWKCVDAELQRHIRCLPYVELSDVGRQRNLGIVFVLLKTVLRIYNNKPLKFAEDIHPTFRLRGSFEQNIVNIVANVL